MTSFSFTAEQIKSAPPEVRRWFENQIVLLVRELTEQRPEPAHAPELTACTAEEAEVLFELLRADFAATQVLLELGREAPLGTGPSGLHALSIAEIKRNLRLPDDRLADCFGAINHAFMRLRNDAEASLFGFDQVNHVYIHETTHRSIMALWQKLLHQQTASPHAASYAPATFGFAPPRLGPSEDVAAHV